MQFKNKIFPKHKSNKKKIFKHHNWTITIYYHTPSLINATGLKSKEEIKRVIAYLEQRYKNICLSHKIDSTMISHRDNKLIQMNEVQPCLKTLSTEYYCDYEPEIFNGIFLKPICREYPTINLFYTGSFQLLGGRSFDKIEEAITIIKSVIKKCETKQDGLCNLKTN